MLDPDGVDELVVKVLPTRLAGSPRAIGGDTDAIKQQQNEFKQFQRRVVERSGTGERTAWPPAITACLKPGVCYNPTLENVRESMYPDGPSLKDSLITGDNTVISYMGNASMAAAVADVTVI